MIHVKRMILGAIFAGGATAIFASVVWLIRVTGIDPFTIMGAVFALAAVYSIGVVVEEIASERRRRRAP